MIDLDAIRARIRNSAIFAHHPTVHPCSCGECSPVGHPEHKRHADLRQLYADIDTLLAEVERLQVIAGECDDATLERLIAKAETATEAAQYEGLLRVRQHMREHPEDFDFREQGR